jgi:hypothetical protein
MAVTKTMWNGDYNPELYRRSQCYACDKVIRRRGYLVGCQDDQTVYVGPECFRHIKAAGANGYQPALGGPRLYLLAYTKHAKELQP